MDDIEAYLMKSWEIEIKYKVLRITKDFDLVIIKFMVNWRFTFHVMFIQIYFISII